MITWIFRAALSIVATALTILFAPLLVLFASDCYGRTSNGSRFGTEPRLPWWLTWFETPDNSLLGDDGHKERWDGKPRYMQMVAWLWRNPAYNFDIRVIGAQIPAGASVKAWGDPLIKNRDNGRGGVYFCVAAGYWNLKAVAPIPFIARCFQFEYGWKLQPWAQGRDVVLSGGTAQLVGAWLLPRFTAFSPSSDII